VKERISASIDVSIRLMAPIQVGEEARDFTLKTVDGKTFNLASFKGKKVVVLGIVNPYG
jgi:peroxiredoxin